MEFQFGTNWAGFSAKSGSVIGQPLAMEEMCIRDSPWWARIAALDLAATYGVRPPTAPKLQPWGLIVAYVVDPSDVLWHIAQRRSR